MCFIGVGHLHQLPADSWLDLLFFGKPLTLIEMIEESQSAVKIRLVDLCFKEDRSLVVFATRGEGELFLPECSRLPLDHKSCHDEVNTKPEQHLLVLRDGLLELP